MKTTLELPDELLREIKLRAVVQGRTVKNLVEELLREGLGMTSRPSTEPSGSSMVEISESGLPTFRCRSGARSTGMTPEELLKLEHQTQAREDLRHAGISV